MTHKELYNICHDEAVAYANSEQWSKRTGTEKSFLIQGYLDAMMKMRKSEITNEYPTTYKECCDVLGLDTMDNDAQGYKAFVIIQFQELLIARDAYWKIAGDWKEKRKEKSIHYVIYSTLLCEVVKDTMPNCIGNYLLDFPTQEMQEAFYENFKELINDCKELL